MLVALASETVYEAQRNSRRTSFLIFCLLALVSLAAVEAVVCLIWVLFLVNVVSLGTRAAPHPIGFLFLLPPLKVQALACLGGLVLAGFHFWVASSQTVESLCLRLQGRPVDPQDDLHRVFADIVAEAEAATGISPIRPFVLSSPALNAFSLQGRRGGCAIGVTEGLLVSLSRDELEAVVAHEVAHLYNHDSRLKTVACSMVWALDDIANFLFPGGSEETKVSRAGLQGWAVGLLALAGKAVSDLLCCVISRQREYLADANAVAICKDPLALASALNKVWKLSGARLQVPDGFSALFISGTGSDPGEDPLGFLARLFSTHPPMRDRLLRLMPWCRTDLPTFEEGQKGGLSKAPPEPVVRESLAGLACTACHVPFEEWRYEGCRILRCPSCGGTFLAQGILERLIARQWLVFSPEQKAQARAWRDSQKGTLRQRGLDGPGHVCPHCSSVMGRVLYSLFTQVVVERCPDPACRSVWCDAGKLEVMQALVQDGNKLT
jgi:heat shock protein HtpX